ncbi:MAG TPA: hypothetical protein VGC41_13115 [Kofleriaceae bacterium]
MKWLLILCLAACSDEVDPEWQLDHTRIIAVRATPPRIQPGEQAQIDLLFGMKGAATSMPAPDQVVVISPMSLADTVAGTTVTAPSTDRLAEARTELALAADAPVPLELGVTVSGVAATKTVYLGATADNPTLDNIVIGGVPAPDAGQPITVPFDTDVHMGVDADDSNHLVDWYSSCGTMHDFDLHLSYIHVEADDPQTGELALIVRDLGGGVVWRVWPISATGSPTQP